MLKTPVLFLIFNRPDVSLRVFESIVAAQPEQLFIAADGPRPNNLRDKELCQKTRKQIMAAIDWPCKVETLFREDNLGCRKAVSQGISWFFNQVESGIILEDDCLASQDFFLYCQKMLEEYKNYPDIGMVGGVNFSGDMKLSESFYFSKYIIVWGWATWRNKWALYQDNLEAWKEVRKSSWLFDIYKNKNIASYYTEIFDKMSEGMVDTWDSNWTYSLLRSDQIVICPTKNLVSNIGFVGTFANQSHLKFLGIPTQRLDVTNLVRPREILVNKELDRLQYHSLGLDRFSLKVFLRIILKDTWLLSVIYKVKKLIKK